MPRGTTQGPMFTGTVHITANNSRCSTDWAARTWLPVPVDSLFFHPLCRHRRVRRRRRLHLGLPPRGPSAVCERDGCTRVCLCVWGVFMWFRKRHAASAVMVLQQQGRQSFATTLTPIRIWMKSGKGPGGMSLHGKVARVSRKAAAPVLAKVISTRALKGNRLVPVYCTVWSVCSFPSPYPILPLLFFCPFLCDSATRFAPRRCWWSAGDISQRVMSLTLWSVRARARLCDAADGARDRSESNFAQRFRPKICKTSHFRPAGVVQGLLAGQIIPFHRDDLDTVL